MISINETGADYIAARNDIDSERRRGRTLPRGDQLYRRHAEHGVSQAQLSRQRQRKY
jgi:hypothetical protein